MAQQISMFACPHPATLYGFVFAIVPGDMATALRRLCNDDPLWSRPDVRYFWTQDIAENSRLRVRDRMRIFTRGKKAAKVAKAMKAAA